ncbi:MAG: acetoin utilization protein AcuC, partial [Thermoplasmata archaeon]
PPDSGGLRWRTDVPPADHSTLIRFHREEYIQLVEGASSLERRVWLDSGDTPAFLGCHEAAARLAQGSVDAVDAAIEHSAPAFQPGGGLHHAHRGRASGFCIYNDVALAVDEACRKVGKVAYVDIDAHHGDGIMYGFYARSDVLDIDLHQDGSSLFPGTGDTSETGVEDGKGLKINLPLPAGAGDRALVGLLHRVVLPILREYGPQLVLLQHGVDGHAGDPLAQLQYTRAGYVEVVRELLAYTRANCSGRLVVTGGGGYDPTNVALTLARVGKILGGGPDGPPVDAALPPQWRDAYTLRANGEAPRRWSDEKPATSDTWTPAAEQELVSRLETDLGRRFPKVP